MPNTNDNEQSAASGTHTDSSRRRFMLQSAAAVGSTGVAGAFEAFLSRTAFGSDANRGPGYGKLSPVKDDATGLELLSLPEGFRYSSFGWTKDPMTGGGRTPGSHDGMGVIAEKDGVVTICRNHEVTLHGKPFGPEAITYDAAGGGGCTMLRFDTKAGEWVDSRPGIAGTVRNCAGGPTPWGSWLTCEETVAGRHHRDKDKIYLYEETHGWIFEVPAEGKADPTPLKDMGRFIHEAIAVDPETGFVYETEDRATSGFYRFMPNEKGVLKEGGRLQMLKVAQRPDLRNKVDKSAAYDVEWVDIDDPERPHSPDKIDNLGVYMQGKQQQATTFARLEGCWYGHKSIFFTATSGGDAGAGQVWQYDPAGEQLRLVYESPGNETLDMPDNLAVSPRGGIVLCEDGKVSPQRVHGLTPDGRLFELVANNMQLKGERNGFKGDYRPQEFAGATFSPDGKWLFVNVQTPGVTFAITGPWERGGV